MSWQLTRTKVTTTVDLSGVLSPQQLFDQLMNVDLKGCQCKEQPPAEDSSGEERTLLLKLIQQYRAEISQKSQEIADAQRLMEMRANLYLELERLKNERARIQQNVAAQTQVLEQEHRVKLAGIGEADCGYVAEQAQLLHLRDANDKLRMRLRDLLEYIARMEGYNAQLSQNHLLLSERLHRQQVPPTRDYEERQRLIDREQFIKRIEMRTQQNIESTRRAEELLKRQQAEAMANVRAQEQQIHRRNMARISSLRTTYGGNIRSPSKTDYEMYGMPKTFYSGEQRGNFQHGVFFPDHSLYNLRYPERN